MRRLVVALLLVAAAACSPGTTAPNLANQPTGGSQTKTGTIAASAEHEVETASTGPGLHCGYERWLVKTGQDATATQVTTNPRATSIAAMALLPSPLPKQHGSFPPQVNKRLAPHEFQSVQVSATVIAYRVENDSDIHLVVSDGLHHTMIAELPNPACMGNSPWVAKVTTARNAFLARTHYAPTPWASPKSPPPFVKANFRATLTGVVFFDWPHNQYGAAKTNAVEVHPVLAVSFP